jgi:hypothetical protein
VAFPSFGNDALLDMRGARTARNAIGMSEISMTVTVEWKPRDNPWPPFAEEYAESEAAQKAQSYQAETRVKFAMQTALANLMLPISIERIAVEFHKPAEKISP